MKGSLKQLQLFFFPHSCRECWCSERVSGSLWLRQCCRSVRPFTEFSSPLWSPLSVFAVSQPPTVHCRAPSGWTSGRSCSPSGCRLFAGPRERWPCWAPWDFGWFCFWCKSPGWPATDKRNLSSRRPFCEARPPPGRKGLDEAPLPLWELRFWWTPRKCCWPWTSALGATRASSGPRRRSKTQCSPRRTRSSGRCKRPSFHLRRDHKHKRRHRPALSNGNKSRAHAKPSDLWDWLMQRRAVCVSSDAYIYDRGVCQATAPTASRHPQSAWGQRRRRFSRWVRSDKKYCRGYRYEAAKVTWRDR